MPSVSQDGQTTDLSGQDRAPANHSQRRESKKAKRTRGTSGRSSIDSSVPDGPLSSWENRLRQRLERAGSTECVLTWKPSTTPAGRSLFRLVPSTRPIEEIDFGLWQTPVADDAVNRAKGKINSRGEPKLSGQVKAMWPTPTARDHFPAHSPEYIAAKKAQGHGMANLNDTVSLAMWPTPTSRDHKDGTFCPNVPTNSLLGRTVWNGSSEQTEKPGALNPQFVCWLMGFPPEWDASAPTEMPSSRKSRRKS